jgi:hypothetical protein
MGGLVGLLSTRARALLLSLPHSTFSASVALVAVAPTAAALAGWGPYVLDTVRGEGSSGGGGGSSCSCWGASS